MKIRAITFFTDLPLDEPEIPLARTATFLHTAAPVFEKAGFAVQTCRVASQPFPRILASIGPGLAVAYAQRVEELIRSYGIDYLSLGPVDVDDDPDFVDAIPSIIGTTETVFCAITIADPVRGIDLPLLWQAVDVIQQVSGLSADGLENLYLAMLANCPPGAPFFPAAYHRAGDPPAFALAIQAADLAIQAFACAESVADAQRGLTEAITRAAADLEQIAGGLAAEFEIGFGGLDFSLAPFPDEVTSLGGAMERLGVSLGGGGAAAAAALIMSALDEAVFHRAGFSGLMLPVMEDSILAARAAAGELSVTDLLLYSTLCGTGLDTIPLPGDTPAAALVGMLLDVAALALRLNKPLTARLMPLPGKKVGDSTGLEHFSYFAPGRVMPFARGVTPGGLMAGDGVLRIRAR